MASTIKLEIVTPEGRSLSEEVAELCAPGVLGEFGVLPRHRPLLAGLKTGILRYKVEGEERAVAIGPGFAKVADDFVSVLTDQFITKAAVDPVVTRRELRDAQELIAGLGPDAPIDDKQRAVRAVRWAAVRLELYGDPPPATVIIAQEMRLLGHEDYTSTLATAEPMASGASGAFERELDR